MPLAVDLSACHPADTVETCFTHEMCRVCGKPYLMLLRYQRVIYKVYHWLILLLVYYAPLRQQLSMTFSQLFKSSTLMHNALTFTSRA